MIHEGKYTKGGVSNPPETKRPNSPIGQKGGVKMTFDEYAKYLNEKEQALKEAASQAIGTIEVPIECGSTIEIKIDLEEVSQCGKSCREFVVTDASINVEVRF